MADVRTWSTTAASNNSAPPDGAPENMNYSAVNDTMREMMAAVARQYQDTRGGIVAGGTANALTLATQGTYTTAFAGLRVSFEAANTNTGAATIAVDSIAATAIVAPGGDALQGGEIIAGRVYDIVYDGTQFQLMSTSAPPSLELGGSSAVDLTDSNNVLNVGMGSGAHIAMDTNDIQAKANATTAAALLSINQLGGGVNIGAQQGTGQVQLFNGANTYALATDNQGVRAQRNTGSTTFVYLQDASSNRELSIISQAAGDAIITANLAGRGIQLRGRNAGDTADNTLFAGDPDGTVTLYSAGTRVFQANAAGVNVYDAGGDDPLIGMFQDDGLTRNAYIWANGTTGYVELVSEMDGGEVRLRGNSSLSVLRNILVGDPDAGVSLYHSGNVRLEVIQQGARISGFSEPQFDVIGNSAFGAEINVYDTVNNGGVQILAAGGATGLYNISTTGANRGIWINMLDQGAVTLYHNNTQRMATTAQGIAIDPSVSNPPEIIAGSGTPEGAITAPPGSIFLRRNGGAGTGFYVKESGTGNTGWVAK